MKFNFKKYKTAKKTVLAHNQLGCPVCNQNLLFFSGNPVLISGDFTQKCKRCGKIVSIKEALKCR